jgi:hypothetical protein
MVLAGGGKQSDGRGESSAMLTLFAEEKKNGNKGLEKVRTDGEKGENRKFSIFERTERRKMGPAKWPNKARAYKK